MHTTKPRKRRGRRSAVLIATFTLMASALTLVAAPTAGLAEELPTAQTLSSQEPVFSATIDADGIAVARKAYKAKTTGRPLFIMKWSGDAHLKVFILNMNGDVIAKKGNDSQPKKVWADLEAGEKYKIKVKAASGNATFNAVVRAPVFDIDSYFNDMPSWSEAADEYGYLPLTDDCGDGDCDNDDWSAWVQEADLFCRTRIHDLSSAAAEEIVTFGVADSWLYPGVLLQGDGFAGGITDVQQLPIRQREPAEVFINFTGVPGTEITRTVDDPTPANIAAAVSAIVADAQAASVEPSTSIFFEETQTHSAQQMALELGLSVRYMKSGIQTKLQMERSGTETTLTVYFKEAAFTAAVTQPQTPADFFSDDLTQAILDRQIDLGRLDDNSNLPLYVDSVTYGRILAYSLTSSEDITTIRTALNAMYDGGALKLEGEAKAAWDSFVATSERRIVTVGGDSSDAAAAITSGDFTEYFNDEPELTEYAPISYVIKDLQGEVAYVEETETYTERECTEAIVNVTVDGILVVDAQDDDGTDEVDIFNLEARAFHGIDEPVFDGSEACWPDDGQNWQEVICWDEESPFQYELVTEGVPWQDADAQAGLWHLPIAFDDLDEARLMFRTGYQDDDPGEDDWTSGDSGAFLIGEEIWADTIPDDGDPATWLDESTYRFQVDNNSAVWWVYLTIELAGSEP